MEAARQPPSVVPNANQAVPGPACALGATYVRSSGEQMPTEILIVEPELIADGMFWALALDDDRVFTISGFRNNNVVPEVAEVLSFDLASLERRLLFSKTDGFQDPGALLVHEDTLYIQDWATGDLFQSPLEAPALNVLATDLGGGVDLARWEAAVFMSDYRRGRVFRVWEPTAANAALAGAPLDVQTVVVEELSQVPRPTGIAAWQGHAAWGTHGYDGTGENQLVIRDLTERTDLSIDVAGSISSIDVNTTELAWATYGQPSELSRMPLDQSGSPVGDDIDTLMFCGQPTSAALHGTLAVYGGPRLMLWERGASVLQVLHAGFVRYLVVNAEHIYFANWDGLYRIPRP